MNKEIVRAKIANYLDKLLDELNVELASKLEGAVMQCSDVNNIDSHSQQFQVIKEEQGVKDRIDTLLKEKKYFHNIPITKADKVKEGALVEIKDYYIYVGISTPAIGLQSKKIVGMSTAAPIYKSLVDRSEGFEFNYNGVNCVIESIQ